MYWTTTNVGTSEFDHLDWKKEEEEEVEEGREK